MCGIVGYLGHRQAQSILLDGLRTLEYRGYDSAGLATVADERLHVCKSVGRVADLAEKMQGRILPGSHGIGHTRWATHGGVTNTNAHPHVGGNDDVAIVHNGVIENHAALRRELETQGFVFRGETDSEVVAHLIAHYLEGDLVEAVRRAVARLRGAYALAVISPRHPGTLVGARLGSPLVLGIGHDEVFLASDPSPLIGQAEKVIYLSDRQLGVATPSHWDILDLHGAPVEPILRPLDGVAADRGKGDFPHYMLKEIHEQPETLSNVLHGRLEIDESSFEGLSLTAEQLRRTERVVMIGCGTSYHAALIGEYLFEELARLSVEVEYASEFRYRQRPSDGRTLVVVLSQSGETADTLAALREAGLKGHPTLALCNVPGSTIAREADAVISLRAGPEVGVASTKAFSAQVATLALLALHFGRMRQLSSTQVARVRDDLRVLPEAVRQALACDADVRRIAAKYYHASSCLYLGRLSLYPTALEGALKLKEVSYIHAEGYPAGELKHGPLALIDAKVPSVFLMPVGPIRDKVMSNLEEVKARGGPTIVVAGQDDGEAVRLADDAILVPEVPDYLKPLVMAVPLQLLAYHAALLRGCDVDRPRNLAKSVTVE